LFDISDFHNPKEQDSVIIGGRGTYSEMAYNHKALFRHDAYQYYGFPVTIYKGKGEYEAEYQGAGALVYNITAEDGIQLKADLVTPAKQGEQYEDWESLISRLVYIDEALFTVSPKEIKSYDLQSFKEIGRVKIK
jgi:inhibitor of cysteine peptidase